MITVSIAFGLLLSPLLAIQTVDPGKRMSPQTEAAIKELLNAEEFKQRERDALAKLGGYSLAAFHLYAQILDSDRKEDYYIIQRVLRVLAEPTFKADRSQFLDRAIDKMTHWHSGVRRGALQLVAVIGSAADAAPVVVLLSDAEWTNAIVAAKTLATIGNRRTVAAMDVWLQSTIRPVDWNGPAHAIVRGEVAKARDELKQRLDKEKSPSK